MCDCKAELETLRARIEDIENQLQAKSRRGTRLPEDWELPAEYLQWAREQDMRGVQRFNSLFEVTEEGRKFHDYWISQSGSKGVKANWFSTWKNWIRNAKVTNAKTSNDSRSRAQRHSDKLDEIAKRDVAENGFTNHLDSGHI